MSLIKKMIIYLLNIVLGVLTPLMALNTFLFLLVLTMAILTNIILLDSDDEVFTAFTLFIVSMTTGFCIILCNIIQSFFPLSLF